MVTAGVSQGTVNPCDKLRAEFYLYKLSQPMGST